MRIITISREFGSGGRELGKRIADALGIPCYDQQILQMVAKQSDLDVNYVESRSEMDLTAFYPTTIAHGFAHHNYAVMQSIQIMAAEQEILKKIASLGDCVIVGRAADIVLAEQKPFRIFVCADKSSKIARCKGRANSNEQLSDKDILRKCRDIDKRRASYRKMFTDNKWGEAIGYDLCVNTSNKDIKMLVPAIVDYINTWFEKE